MSKKWILLFDVVHKNNFLEVKNGMKIVETRDCLRQTAFGEKSEAGTNIQNDWRNGEGDTVQENNAINQIVA